MKPMTKYILLDIWGPRQDLNSTTDLAGPDRLGRTFRMCGQFYSSLCKPIIYFWHLFSYIFAGIYFKHLKPTQCALNLVLKETKLPCLTSLHRWWTFQTRTNIMDWTGERFLQELGRITEIRKHNLRFNWSAFWSGCWGTSVLAWVLRN